jgi:signal transduction histidine kinase
MYLHTSETNLPEKFNLRESLDTVLTIYHNQIKHGIRVAIDVPEDIDIHGYSEEIGQVWTNLIVNACQAMNFTGTLVIKASVKQTIAHITISDTGCGIPDEIGGLDIVKNIVLKHSGKIYYESKVGVGTTFHVELPKQIDSSY